MLKSSSNKNAKDVITFNTDENKRAANKVKIWIRTKQNSKIIKEKENTAKKVNLAAKNKIETCNKVLHTLPNKINIANVFKKSSSKKEELNTTTNATVAKPKPANLYQNKITSRKSIKTDEQVLPKMTEEIVITSHMKTMPNTISKKLNRNERTTSSGSIKEIFLNSKPMISPPKKRSSLKKSKSNSKLIKTSPKKNKIYKYTEKIIKELEESKIKDENTLDEELPERRLNTITANENVNPAYNTIITKSMKRNHQITSSPMRDTFNLKSSFKNDNNSSLKANVRTKIMQRPKSLHKEDKIKSGNNIIPMNNTKPFLRPATGKNPNLNNTINVNVKARPKSSYKKPESELKLNEASLSTEASSIFRGRLEDYAIGKEIGKGAYAIVKQALHKPTNRKMAIKIYEKVKLLDTQRKNSVKREIQILKKMDHVNIVKLHEVIDNPKQILLVMELVNGVSLLTFLKSKPEKRITESECRNIFFQIVQAIAHCHSKNICHRDIKLENIIVEENKLIKVIDFGFGTVTTANKLLNFFCGTPSYMPPEIVQKKDYIGQYADIWSLGILLYTLLCGAFPFRALTEKELYSKIIKGVYNFSEHMNSVPSDLLRRILHLTPSNRPSAEEILQDAWFSFESETCIINK